VEQRLQDSFVLAIGSWDTPGGRRAHDQRPVAAVAVEASGNSLSQATDGNLWALTPPRAALPGMPEPLPNLSNQHPNLLPVLVLGKVGSASI
jgi:hypothetical protein